MGCNQSKIENEETVTRCKERKLHMKDAVASRNAFAAAHSAYTMALKNTGAALSDYAHGEVQYPSPPSSSSVHGGPTSLPQPPVDPFPPPPPPLPNFPGPPIQRAASMPEMPFPKPDLMRSDPILEEENENEVENESNHGGLKHRSSKSSGSRSGMIGRSSEILDDDDDEELRKPPSPPAQTPPPPPPSSSSTTKSDRAVPPPPPPENKGISSWDYFFFPSMENVPGTTLADEEEGRMAREEFERKVLQERAKRSEIDADEGIDLGGDVGSTGSVGGRRSGGGKPEPVEMVEKPSELPPQQIGRAHV